MNHASTTTTTTTAGPSLLARRSEAGTMRLSPDN